MTHRAIWRRILSAAFLCATVGSVVAINDTAHAWGAVATGRIAWTSGSLNSIVWGVVSNYATEQEARDAAFAACEAHRLSRSSNDSHVNVGEAGYALEPCVVHTAFQDQCAVACGHVGGDRPPIHGVGPTVEDAIVNAEAMHTSSSLCTSHMNSICDISCNSNEARNADSTACIACTDNEIPNSDQSSCMACPSSQVPNSDNSACMACPNGEEPNSDFTGCVPCAVTEFSTGESCQTCPNGEEPTSDSTACVPCAVTEFSTGESCQTCPNGQEPNASQSGCTECAVNEASSGGAACRVCPDGQESISDRSTCRTCGAREYSTGGMSCRVCPGLMVGNSTNSGCTCPSGSSLLDGSCVCDRDGEVLNSALVCVRSELDCPVGQVPNAANDGCEIYPSCPGGSSPSSDGVSCERCPLGTYAEAGSLICLECLNGTISGDRSECRCRSDQRKNGINCECLQPGYVNMTVGLSNEAFCAAPILSLEDVQYNVTNCEVNDWESDISRDSNGNIAEVCYIPVLIASESSVGSALSRGEILNEPVEGERWNACILRAHENYRTGIRECSSIFGPNGLPVRGTSFNSASDRLLVVLSEDYAVYDPTSLNQRIDSGVIRPESDNKEDLNIALIGVGVVGVVGALTWALSDGEVRSLRFTPEILIERTGGRGHYAYGSRVEFSNESWETYWSASQTHTEGESGEWIYGAGASWHDEIWRASFASETRGEEMDIDMSISARKEVDVWRVSGGFITYWELNEYNNALSSDWESRLHLSAETIYGNWRLTPSAGFSWEEDEGLGEEAFIRLDILQNF